jgi:hypothetical protein
MSYRRGTTSFHLAPWACIYFNYCSTIKKFNHSFTFTRNTINSLWENEALSWVLFFVVCTFSGARQKKRPVKKLYDVCFYFGVRQTNSLSCVFSLARGKHFSHRPLSPLTCSLHLPCAVGKCTAPLQEHYFLLYTSNLYMS